MSDAIALGVETAAPDRPDAYLRVGDHELGYARSGCGPDLVFVHGWPLHSATFRRSLPLFEPDYTCHVFDLPCAGRSRSAPTAAVSFRDQVASLRAAVDRLGLTRYALVAHDSGGMLARHLAAGDARVAGLVLGNTELPGAQPSAIVLMSILAGAPGGAEMFRAAMRNLSFRRSSRGFGACLESRALLEGEFDRLFLEPIFATAAATRRALAMFPSYLELCAELSAVHARLTAPALLIWGDADSFFPVNGARAMLSEFAAGARLETVAGGKLFVHEEHPEEFARAARAFLAHCFAC